MENNGAVTTYNPDQIDEWLQCEDDMEDVILRATKITSYTSHNNKYRHSNNNKYRHSKYNRNHQKKKKQTGNPFTSKKCQDEARKTLAECRELLENEKQQKEETEPAEHYKQRIKVKPPETPESVSTDTEFYIEEEMDLTDNNHFDERTEVISKDKMNEHDDDDTKQDESEENVLDELTILKIIDAGFIKCNKDQPNKPKTKPMDDDKNITAKTASNSLCSPKISNVESIKCTPYKSTPNQIMDDDKSIDITPKIVLNSVYSTDAGQEAPKLSAAAMPFVPNPMDGIIVPMSPQKYESLLQQMYPNGVTGVNPINGINTVNMINTTNGANTTSPKNGITTTDIAVLNTLNYTTYNTYTTPYLYNTASPQQNNNNNNNNNKHNKHHNQYNHHNQYRQNIGDFGDKLEDWMANKLHPKAFMYNKEEYTLICGECDFSFTSSLISKRGRSGMNICCTSWYYYTDQWFKAMPKQIGQRQFESFVDNLKFCKHNGVNINFGVDAKRLKETKKKWNRLKINRFDRIIFTFPEAYTLKTKQNKWSQNKYNKQNEMLLTEIIKSAKSILNEERGEIHIMLLQNQFYEWKLYKILNFLDLEISYWSELDKDSLNVHFNSYIPRDGDGNIMNIQDETINFCSFRMKKMQSYL